MRRLIPVIFSTAHFSFFLHSGCPVDETPDACTMIFNATAGYLIKNGQCCRTAEVGLPNPNWIENLQYLDTTFTYGVKTLHFRGGTPKHNYYVVNTPTQSPSLLLVEDIYEAWQFLEPFQLGPQNPKDFVLPANCSNACSNNMMARKRFQS